MRDNLYRSIYFPIISTDPIPVDNISALIGKTVLVGPFEKVSDFNSPSAKIVVEQMKSYRLTEKSKSEFEGVPDNFIRACLHKFEAPLLTVSVPWIAGGEFDLPHGDGPSRKRGTVYVSRDPMQNSCRLENTKRKIPVRKDFNKKQRVNAGAGTSELRSSAGDEGASHKAAVPGAALVAFSDSDDDDDKGYVVRRPSLSQVEDPLLRVHQDGKEYVITDGNEVYISLTDTEEINRFLYLLEELHKTPENRYGFYKNALYLLLLTTSDEGYVYMDIHRVKKNSVELKGRVLKWLMERDVKDDALPDNIQWNIIKSGQKPFMIIEGLPKHEPTKTAETIQLPIGTRIEVEWNEPDNLGKKFYPGFVSGVNNLQHLIVYDDGDIYWEALEGFGKGRTKWRFERKSREGRF